jgi:hypothetical protein
MAAALASQRLRQEVDLIERFTQSYRRKFAELIERLNGRTDDPSNLQCIRLCIEAVDMMLVSQSQVARSLRELTDPAIAAAAATNSAAA